MNKKKLILAVAIAATVFVGGYSWGQKEADTRDKVAAYRGDIYFAEQLQNVENGNNWAQLQNKAAQDPELLQAAALGAYLDLDKTRASNRLLVIQMMQNQKIIEQNERMIALMEAKVKE